MTFPIILAHGIARFDILTRSDNNFATDHLNYWKNIRSILREKGYVSHHTRVSWAGTVDQRAGQLAEQVKAYVAANGPTRVNIVAHSMGGLDARVAIARCGLGPHVASLTTLHTPHHGSSFADWGFETPAGTLFTRLLGLVGIDAKGFADLTTAACEKRNRELEAFETANVDGIRYQTYAGWQSAEDIFLPLVPSFRIIRKREGRNDGLVSVRSAVWKDAFCRGINGFDHLNVLGWWDHAEKDYASGGRSRREFETEIRSFYHSLAERLP